MNDQQLVDAVMKLGEMMVSAATGKTAINDVNDEFRRRYALVAAALVRRNIPNPLRFGDLWDWWAECKEWVVADLSFSPHSGRADG